MSSEAESSRIQVLLRIRPTAENATAQAKLNYTKHVVEYANAQTNVGTPRRQEHRQFTFQCVAGPDRLNTDVWAQLERFAEDAAAGISSTVMAYGQTASGKTHTMTGRGEEEHGVVQLAMAALSKRLRSEQEENWSWSTAFSYLEIYNNKAYDLLSPDKAERKIVSGEDSFARVVDLTSMRYSGPPTVTAAVATLARGDGLRARGATKLNDHSSRSHTIFEVHLVGKAPLEGLEKRAVLRFVDLAGSENASEAGTDGGGQQLREGKAINQSLLCLTRTISLLARNGKEGASQTGPIEWRSQALLRVLQSSLEGNARIAIICCVNPANSRETLRTLQVGESAQAVSTRVRANVQQGSRLYPLSDLHQYLEWEGKKMQEMQLWLDRRRESAEEALDGLLLLMGNSAEVEEKMVNQEREVVERRMEETGKMEEELKKSLEEEDAQKITAKAAHEDRMRQLEAQLEHEAAEERRLEEEIEKATAVVNAIRTRNAAVNSIRARKAATAASAVVAVAVVHAPAPAAPPSPPPASASTPRITSATPVRMERPIAENADKATKRSKKDKRKGKKQEPREEIFEEPRKRHRGVLDPKDESSPPEKGRRKRSQLRLEEPSKSRGRSKSHARSKSRRKSQERSRRSPERRRKSPERRRKSPERDPFALEGEGRGGKSRKKRTDHRLDGAWFEDESRGRTKTPATSRRRKDVSCSGLDDDSELIHTERKRRKRVDLSQSSLGYEDEESARRARKYARDQKSSERLVSERSTGKRVLELPSRMSYNESPATQMQRLRDILLGSPIAGPPPLPPFNSGSTKRKRSKKQSAEQMSASTVSPPRRRARRGLSPALASVTSVNHSMTSKNTSMISKNYSARSASTSTPKKLESGLMERYLPGFKSEFSFLFN